jgi:hypothetical protein
MDEKAIVAEIQGGREWWNIYLLCTLGRTLFISSLARPRSINRKKKKGKNHVGMSITVVVRPGAC